MTNCECGSDSFTITTYKVFKGQVEGDTVVFDRISEAGTESAVCAVCGQTYKLNPEQVEFHEN